MHPRGWEVVADGIFAIDTGFQRPGFDAAYLVVQGRRAAFIDTGPNLAVPRLLDALEAQGLERQSVDWVILTHVHLDHAGGAGALMQALPQARLVVHPRGARHMADPSKLMAGVRAVYGAEVANRDYGELQPVAPERLLPASSDMTVSLSDRPLRLVETSGHARHHICIWDQQTRGWFTGDTLGLSYPEFRFPRARYGLPSTTPVQFDPDALLNSVQRLLSFEPEAAYLTHYGRIGDVVAQAGQVTRQIRAMVEIAQGAATRADRASHLRQALEALYRQGLIEAGAPAPIEESLRLLATDIELNAQGLEVWLDSDRDGEGASRP
jgi:glyoxylase-like metal-dependent hydrolase (beta-lactamase superfamily II)